MRDLTFRQKRFAELYDGNGVQAAKDSGYKGSYAVLGKTAFDLLKNPKIIALIESRKQKSDQPKIATRQERQAFWTRVLEDDSVEMKDRLKASELLGKSQADFTERVEHSGPVPLTIVYGEQKNSDPLVPDKGNTGEPAC